MDMCQAIQEMRKEERRLGELDGERRGEQRGEQRGERKGELKKARETAGNLYEMGLDVEKIARAVGYAEEIVKGWLGIEA